MPLTNAHFNQAVFSSGTNPISRAFLSYSHANFRALLILNILMVVLDTLSVAGNVIVGVQVNILYLRSDRLKVAGRVSIFTS